MKCRLRLLSTTWKPGLRARTSSWLCVSSASELANLDGIPGIDEYYTNYGVSHERMELASDDAIVMHPGPMNRGIEIEGSLADSGAIGNHGAGCERRCRADGRSATRRQFAGGTMTTAAQKARAT